MGSIPKTIKEQIPVREKLVHIQISVTEAERDAIFDLAGRNNYRTMSEFVRKTILDMVQDDWVKNPR